MSTTWCYDTVSARTQLRGTINNKVWPRKCIKNTGLKLGHVPVDKDDFPFFLLGYGFVEQNSDYRITSWPLVRAQEGSRFMLTIQ